LPTGDSGAARLVLTRTLRPDDHVPILPGKAALQCDVHAPSIPEVGLYESKSTLVGDVRGWVNRIESKGSHSQRESATLIESVSASISTFSLFTASLTWLNLHIGARHHGRLNILQASVTQGQRQEPHKSCGAYSQRINFSSRARHRPVFPLGIQLWPARYPEQAFSEHASY
jgi:hypothetical protein